MTELLNTAVKILDSCRKKGDFDAEVYLLASKQYQIMIDQNVIASQSVVVEAGCGLRIIKNGQLGFSYTNSLDDDGIKKIIDQSLSIAEKSQTDPTNVIPDAKKVPSLDIYSPELAALEADDICEIGTRIIDGVKHDPRIKLTLTTVNSRTSEMAIANTNAVECTMKTTFLDNSILGFARDGDKIGSFSGIQKASRKNDIDIQAMLDDFIPKTINGLDAKPLGDFKGSIIFEPEGFLLPYGFVIMLSLEGNRVHRGSSIWKDKIGDDVAIPGLTVKDLPLQANKPSARPFDDEGIPAENRTIIEKGVLKTFLQTSRSAKKNGVEATGNSMRSFFPTQTSYAKIPSDALPISMTVEPGDMSYEEMIEETKSGIVVGRYSGNFRYQTGEYSGVVKQAVLVENGEIKYPITGVMIAGNTFEDFKNIAGISKERDFTSTFFIESPYIKVEGINVSSGAK